MAKRIVIVDDEEDIRSILGAALTTAGFSVTEADSPEAALHAIEQAPPHLVITDLQFADSDGFELIERLKAKHATIPVIMLTGVIMDPDEIPPEIARLIAGYVPKTAPLEQILREVRKWAA